MADERDIKGTESFMLLTELLVKLNNKVTPWKDKQQAMSQLKSLYFSNNPDDDKFTVSSVSNLQWLNEAAKVGAPETVLNLIAEVCESGIKAEDVDFMDDAFSILANAESSWVDYDEQYMERLIMCTLDVIDHCPFTQLITQCIRLLANVLNDNDSDLCSVQNILNSPVFSKTLSLLPLVDYQCKYQIMYLYYSILMKCRSINVSKLAAVIHNAMSLLRYTTPLHLLQLVTKVLMLAANASNLSNIDHSYATIKILLQSGYVSQITAFLSYHDDQVRNHCLLVLGVIVSGNDDEASAALRSNIMAHMFYLLHSSSDDDCLKNTLWILSNAVACSADTFTCFFQYDFMPLILFYIDSGHTRLSDEAKWVLSNLFVNNLSLHEICTRLLHNRNLLKTLESWLESEVNRFESDTCNVTILSLCLCLSILERLFQATIALSDSSEKQMVLDMLENSKLDACFDRLNKEITEDQRRRITPSVMYVCELFRNLLEIDNDTE